MYKLFFWFYLVYIKFTFISSNIKYKIRENNLSIGKEIQNKLADSEDIEETNLTLEDIKNVSYYWYGQINKKININLEGLDRNSGEITIEFFSSYLINYYVFTDINETNLFSYNYIYGVNYVKINKNTLKNFQDYISLVFNSTSSYSRFVVIDYIENPEIGRVIDQNNYYRFIFYKNFTYYLKNPNYDFIVLKNINTQHSITDSNSFEVTIEFYNNAKILLNSTYYKIEDKNFTYLQFFPVQNTDYMLLKFHAECIESYNGGYIYSFSLLEPKEIFEDTFFISINEDYMKTLNYEPIYYYYNLNVYNDPQIILRYQILISGQNTYFNTLNDIVVWKNNTLKTKSVEINVDEKMKIFPNEEGYLAIIIDPKVYTSKIVDDKYYIKWEIINNTNIKIYSDITISGNQFANEDYSPTTIFCGIVYDDFILRLQKNFGEINIYYKENFLDVNIIDGFSEVVNDTIKFSIMKEICLKVENLEENQDKLSYSIIFFAPCKGKYVYVEPYIQQYNEIIFSLYINENENCYLDRINTFSKYYSVILKLCFDSSEDFSKELDIYVENDSFKGNETLNATNRYKEYFIMDTYLLNSTAKKKTLVKLNPFLTQGKYIINLLEETGSYEAQIIPTYSMIKNFKHSSEIDYSESRVSLYSYKFKKDVRYFKNLQLNLNMIGKNQFLIYWKYYGKCDKPIFEGISLKNPIIGPGNFTKTFINDYNVYVNANISNEDEICLIIYYEDNYDSNSIKNSLSFEIKYIDEIKIDTELKDWEIALIVIGCIIAVGLVVFLIYWFKFRNKKVDEEKENIRKLGGIKLII